MAEYLTDEEIKEYAEKARDKFLSLVPEYQRIKKELFDAVRLYIQLRFYLDASFVEQLSEKINVSKKYILNILSGAKLTERIVYLIYESEKKHISRISEKTG